MSGQPAERQRLDLTELSDVQLAHHRVDTFDRLEVAQFVWDQYVRSSEQDSSRGHYLAQVLSDAHDDWIAVHEERTRREPH